jgi:hypothetical protein
MTDYSIQRCGVKDECAKLRAQRDQAIREKETLALQLDQMREKTSKYTNETETKLAVAQKENEYILGLKSDAYAELESMDHKLRIATKALEWIDSKCSLASDPVAWPKAHQALAKLKDGHTTDTSQSERPVGAKLHSTMDSTEWAAEFMRTLKTNPGLTVDYDLMHVWFANAIMVGWDHAHQRSGGALAEKDSKA